MFGRATPTCDTALSSGSEKQTNQPLAMRKRGLIEVIGRATPTCDTALNSGSKKQTNQPLTPKKEGLTEMFGRASPTCDTESNSDFDKPKNRLPLPRERAGVRGKSTSNPKPNTRSSPLNRPSVSSPAFDFDLRARREAEREGFIRGKHREEVQRSKP